MGFPLPWLPPYFSSMMNSLHLLLGAPLLQPLILLLRQAHEGAVLRTGDALDVARITEGAQVLVGLADAVVLRAVTILYVGHAPRAVADELEGT